MKVKASIKKRSADCKVVRRKGRVYIINKKLIEAKRVLNGLNDMTEPQQERKSKLLKSL